MIRKLRGLALLALVIAAVTTASAAASPTAGRQSYTGTIGGAAFRVEVPEHWNGRLVLFSHGYLPPGFPSFGISLTNRPPGSEGEAWLLDHGYALAASQFQENGLGYYIEHALDDQMALLDWFEAHVGRPRETVATGQSLGAGLALLLAERHPDRFAGAMPMCGVSDPLGMFNAELDINFAVKVLLAPGQDIALVHASDPAHTTAQLVQAIQQGEATPQGRARLALAASLNNVPGWYSAHQPRPTDLDEWIHQQALWIANAYVTGRGPTARADLERRAGGNPLWNIGVSYHRQLARSPQRDLVRQAYRQAGLSLRRDLRSLDRAPRIAPDLRAVAYMYRFGVPTGRIAGPVLTLHSVGDGGAVPDQDRWYADLVRRHGGSVRSLFVDRGMHCSYSAADEIVALRTLFERIDTGRWPDTSPARLNAEVRALGDPYQLVFDIPTFSDAPMPPAFTEFTPPRPQRPSR